MKAFIALAIVALSVQAFAALSDEDRARGEEIARRCGEQNGLTADDYGKLRNGDFSDTREALQCFANCVSQELGFTNDGVLQEDVIIEKLSPVFDRESVQQAIEICRGIQGANNCETSFRRYECFYRNKVTA